MTELEILKQFEDELPELHRSATLRDIKDWVLNHTDALTIRNSRQNVARHFSAQLYDLQFRQPTYEKNIYDRKEDEYRSGVTCTCVMKLIDFNNGFHILDGTGIILQNGKSTRDGLTLHCEAHFYEEDWPMLLIMAKMNSVDGKSISFNT